MPRGGKRTGAGQKEKSKPATLEEEYKDNPALLRMYQKKLLLRGWAGQLSETERRYRQESHARQREHSTAPESPKIPQSVSNAGTSSGESPTRTRAQAAGEKSSKTQTGRSGRPSTR